MHLYTRYTAKGPGVPGLWCFAVSAAGRQAGLYLVRTSLVSWLAVALLHVAACAGEPMVAVPEAAQEVMRSTAFVVISQDGGVEVALGTGVCIQPDYVITNQHAVTGVLRTAVGQGRKRWTAILVRVNPDSNLAILHVPGLQARAAEIRDSSTLRAGEPVFGLLPGAPDVRVLLGQVSGVRVREKQTVLEVTTAAALGQGGGPLFDRQGGLVGLTAFHLRERAEAALAVPGETVRAAFQDLRPTYERRPSTLTPLPATEPPSVPATGRQEQVAAAPPPFPRSAAVPAPPPVAARPAPVQAPAAPQSSVATASTPAQHPTGPDDLVALHRQSQDAYVAGDFQSAIAGFNALRARGLSREADAAALYWLAESYYHAHEYEPARQALQQLIAQYPDLPRAPTAYLRLGETYAQLRQPALAQAKFCEIVRSFAQSAEAVIVRERGVRCQ